MNDKKQITGELKSKIVLNPILHQGPKQIQQTQQQRILKTNKETDTQASKIDIKN
jgi:hypothetical protein